MTTRSVKYILKKALRAVGEETDFTPASEESYSLAYDNLIDLLDEMRSKNIQVFQNNPSSIDDNLSSADPVTPLSRILAVKIAPEFMFEPTRTMGAQSVNAWQFFRGRRVKIPTIGRPCGMPRGSDNYYWYWYGCEESSSVCAQSGVPIVTGNN